MDDLTCDIDSFFSSLAVYVCVTLKKNPQECCKIAGIAIAANCIAIHIENEKYRDTSMHR